MEQYGGTGRRLERRERRQPFAEPGSAGRERKAARGVRLRILFSESIRSLGANSFLVLATDLVEPGGEIVCTARSTLIERAAD